MSEDFEENRLKEIAAQLSCPAGEKGVKTAENMAVNNDGMTRLAVSAIDLVKDDVVLEIGPGNGSHVSGILKGFKHVLYYGVDISELMVTEAQKLNKGVQGADFSLSDGHQLNFADEFFSKVFTVNTIYFWKDPEGYLKEIFRVLKPAGMLSVAFGAKEFMAGLAFTKYGFNLYSSDEVCQLLTNAGFEINGVKRAMEQVRSNGGGMVNREVVVVSGLKSKKQTPSQA